MSAQEDSTGMSSLSLAVSCVVFTLAEREPSENQYMSIFTIWLSQLIHAGGLTKADALYITLDTRTSQYLNDHTIFATLLLALPCPYYIRQMPPPKTLLEGMLWKYEPHDYTQDAFMYCDIDILILRDLHTFLIGTKDESILVHHEDSLSNPDFGAVFIHQGEVIPKNVPGFSAGKFIILGKTLCTEFLKAVKQLAGSWSGESFYTCEQPFFNKIIYSMNPDHTSIDSDTLTEPHISQNGHTYKPGVTVLLDCMGDPGNQDMHYRKILDYFQLLRVSESLLL
jgi:hypothetical protein